MRCHRGCRMDLQPVQMETADLQQYCYHVAGAVGLCCLRIWEVDASQAQPLAIDCGLAFQLTNILRDLKEDSIAGRIYLPREDLERFHYESEDLLAARRNVHFTELMRFEVSRAREYYRSASRLSPYLSAETRPVLGTMLRIYSGLLDKIEHRRFDVFSERVRLSTWYKFRTVATEIVRARFSL
ncbi:MAG: squalene/phytoene synthase family protein [Planctomycetales bacterium]